MAALPQEIITAIENLVEEKFTELIKSHKLNPTEIDMSVKTFQEEQMYLYNKIYDGHDHIEQGFFRKFLDWLALKLGQIENNIITPTLDAVKYITPVDYSPPPDCGKIIAPFANLVVEGEDFIPYPPYPDKTVTPDSLAFYQAWNLMFGGMGYNKTDNKWYYRGWLNVKQIFGGLYNWFSVDTGKLAPEDWHVSTSEELYNLMRAYDPDGIRNNNTAGYQLREPGRKYWTKLIPACDNSSGFFGRGGGTRSISDYGDHYEVGFDGFRTNLYLWCAEEMSEDSAFQGTLNRVNNNFGVPHNGEGNGNNKRNGASVVCVKNTTNLLEGEESTVTDIDGNIYRSKCIGGKEYMMEVLKTTKYKDNTDIPIILDNDEWLNLTTGAMCFFDADVNGFMDFVMDIWEALALEIFDITGLYNALKNLVPKEAGKGLSENDFTDELKAIVEAAEAHMAIPNPEVIPPDNVSIEQSYNNKLAVKPSWILALLKLATSLAPLRYNDEDGSVYLDIDENTLAIVDGKLTVIGGEGSVTTKLTFTPETGILAVDPDGESEVDLSSLAAGEGVDLSNYLKKTGESSQTVEGDLKVTGEVEPYA
jgi:uncharacterized protein (TIGR02145 family)